MPRVTRAEAKAQTRARLLESAAKVFAEKGFFAATIEEIVDDAGYTRGAFYANFADKADVLLTVLDEGFGGTFAHLIDLMEMTPDNEKLPAAQGWYEEAMQRSAPLELAAAELMTQAWRDPDLRRRFAARQERARQAVATTVQAYCDMAGVTLPIPVADFAAVAFAIGTGLGNQRRLDPDAVSPELFTKAQVWLWAGVLASETAPAEPPAKRARERT